MKLCINPLTVYGAREPAEAFSDMAARGFHDFELWHVDPGMIPSMKSAMDEAGMRLAAFCTRVFDLTDPERRAAYLEGLAAALADAASLGCRMLITQVGPDTGAPRSLQHESILAGLRACVPMLAAAGVTLLVEPLNTVKDHPGYYLTDSLEAFDLIEAVDSPHVRVLYDVYHQLHMGEPVMDRIRSHVPLIGHIHLAGLPQRDEKLFVGYDHTDLFRMLDKVGYRGLAGLELFPSPGSREALFEQLKPFLGPPAP